MTIFESKNLIDFLAILCYIEYMSPFVDFLYAIYKVNPSDAKRRFIGGTAERDVHWLLKQLPREFIVLHDILLPNAEWTQRSQIDHLVISRYGIFCIETKGWTGKIYGNGNSSHVSVFYGGQRYRQYSPFAQNQSHLRTLNHLLGDYLRAPIIPLTVFPQAAQLTLYDTTGAISLDALLPTIQSYTKEIYSEQAVASIAATINEHNQSHEVDAVQAHRQRVALLTR